MKKIAILSFYTGKENRGVETWAEDVRLRFSNIVILSGSSSYNPLKWFSADVLIPTNGRTQILLCKLFCLLTHKKMIVFGHSGPGADDKWNLLCTPDIFVTFSDFQKKWAEKYKLPWTKIIKINHAVDSKRFTKSKIKHKGKVVLCVAANTEDKRISLVEKAVKKLKNVEFVAVGKGNKLVLSHNKMPDVYKKADVFCFVPQPWEAFGLVFLEALASNLPVVTIDDPVRREIVGEAGIFVKHPENSLELSKAIDKALKKNWGDTPRKQAEKFSWVKIAKQYSDLFNNI